MRTIAIGIAVGAIILAASTGPVGRALLLFGSAVIGAVVALAAVGAAMIGRDR